MAHSELPYFASTDLLDLLAPLGLHVADGHEADVGLFQEAAQVVAAAIADADAADDDLFARRHNAVLAERLAGNEGRYRGKAGRLGRRREESPPRKAGWVMRHRRLLVSEFVWEWSGSERGKTICWRERSRRLRTGRTTQHASEYAFILNRRRASVNPFTYMRGRFPISYISRTCRM